MKDRIALENDSEKNPSGRGRENKKKRNELLLLTFLLAVIALSFLVSRRISQKEAFLVEVSVGGQVTATYRLDEEVDTVIESAGGANRLILHDGGAYMKEASCPDKICVHQGVIRETGQSLVCLPNKVIVTIK